MIVDSLNESYDSLSKINDSDTDPLFRIESESNSDFQDSTEDEEEDEDEDHSISVHNTIQSTWNTVSGNYQKHFNFIGNYGPLVILDEVSEPIDFFKLFLTDEIIQLMVIETNRNAQQLLSSQKISRRSRFSSWEPVTKDDIEHFLGLLLWMGLVKMPSLSDYWNRAERYQNNVASKTMSRNKFELILRFWHFENNNSADKTDRLYKIRKLLNMANDRFKNVHQPGEIIAVDESMIPYRGRLQFRQYIPNKTHKYGVKFFKACGSNGYTYKIIIYEGKQSIKGESLTETIVSDLCENYLNEGRTIVTDNFYTSVPLAEKMLSKNTHLVGTLRKNRRFLPKTVIGKKIKKGEIFGLENNSGIVISKFKDKRDIYLLSTRHLLGTSITEKKTRNHEDIIKPDVILFYNAGKAGIDLSDQLASYCTPMRKSIRWYHKVATEIILNTFVVNAQIMYNQHNFQKKLSIRQFRELIVDKLLKLEPSSRTTVSQTSATQKLGENRLHRRLALKHKLEETEDKCHRNRKIRRCTECYKNYSAELGYKEAVNKAKKVATFCSICPSKPFVCLQCFQYHQQR
ncbi:hypothetical protein QTP88_019389 [Uroleucon formosanum]